MIIVSGANENRFDSETNHKRYSEYHGFDYRINYRNDLKKPFYIKFYTILESFKKGYNEVLWIDDDAFFIDFSWNAKQVFEQNTNKELIVTKHPKSKIPKMLFNSGIMFFRNTENTKNLINKCLEITDEEIKKMWNSEKFGKFEGNDQPRLVYYSLTEFRDILEVKDYPGFNTKPNDFFKGKVFPIVHFPGPSEKKLEKMKNFEFKTGIKLL